MDATQPDDLGYTVEHDPVEGALLVTASGELDLAAAPRLATVLSIATAGQEPCVVLDLTAVDFIDSTALGAIMHASTEAEATGKHMLVVALDGPGQQHRRHLRRVRDPGDGCPRARAVHEHAADGALPWRRPSRRDLCD